MPKPDIDTVLTRLQRKQEALERSLAALHDPRPGEQRDIISRIAVEGRAVTSVLQNLRGLASGFDEWYQPNVTEMADDPLMRFFYELRTERLKKGHDRVRGVVLRPGRFGIKPSEGGVDLTFPDASGALATVFVPRPENAVGMAIGDQQGGSGWVVQNSDGSRSTQYFAMPSTAADITVLFEHPPTRHLGAEVVDIEPRNLCSLYVAYLRRLVQEAMARFRSNGPAK